jgi:hypothetical protein
MRRDRGKLSKSNQVFMFSECLRSNHHIEHIIKPAFDVSDDCRWLTYTFIGILAPQILKIRGRHKVAVCDGHSHLSLAD